MLNLGRNFFAAGLGNYYLAGNYSADWAAKSDGGGFFPGSLTGTGPHFQAHDVTLRCLIMAYAAKSKPYVKLLILLRFGYVTTCFSVTHQLGKVSSMILWNSLTQKASIISAVLLDSGHHNVLIELSTKFQANLTSRETIQVMTNSSTCLEENPYTLKHRDLLAFLLQELNYSRFLIFTWNPPWYYQRHIEVWSACRT